MNPTMNHESGAGLPVPRNESYSNSNPEEYDSDNKYKSEKAGKDAELPLASAKPSLPAHGAASVPPPISNLSGQAPADHSKQTPARTGAPPIAADVDLIEQEWVSRAKRIVEQTREDPHMQNKEMSKFKADYIKKRYNKDIKVGE